MEYKDVCPLSFYTIGVNSDGHVSICTCDMWHAHIVGDINKTSLKEIWFGDAFNEFRKMHLRRERYSNEFCGGCGAIYNTIDNIDLYAETLLDKYN